jgi:hypothetical protein
MNTALLAWYQLIFWVAVSLHFELFADNANIQYINVFIMVAWFTPGKPVAMDI